MLLLMPQRKRSFIEILIATILVSTIAIFHQTVEATDLHNSIASVPPYKGFPQFIIGSTAEETTTLSLYSVSQVKEGGTVEFTGKLITESGKGVVKAFIKIIDQSASDASKRSTLAGAITDSDGAYKATWVAEHKRCSNTIIVIAQFDGNSNYLASRSNTVTITLLT